MSVMRPFTCRGVRGRKRMAMVTLIAMLVSPLGGPVFVPTVKAQAQVAPVNQGFVLTSGDVQFIFHQIEVAQAHAAGGTLLGPGPNQVNLFGNPNPQLPIGLRTVDGNFNNLVPGQEAFGASDRLFPRLTTTSLRAAEAGTSYTQLAGNVIDSQPRVISNLIVDQTAHNPAALAASLNPCGSGGFVCSGPSAVDAPTGTFLIPNITPDFGLSAPFNLMFTFFGQFFDHGLDLVNKGGNGTVIMPLQPDDPLFVSGADTNFMAMPRGSVDANHNGINQTTPWVDQNQTYTSHASHQVFLREYDMVASMPVPNGKVLDGGFCAPRATGIPGDEICNVGNWAQVKAQASTKLGIRLVDTDVFDVPLLLTDPYGHFKPGAHGFPQLRVPAGTPCVGAPSLMCLEGDPTANLGAGVDDSTSLRTGHQFLNDIAHNAAPAAGLVGVRDGFYCDFRSTTAGPNGEVCPTAPGTYDGDVLDAHFVTGDGRGNENIALSAMHNIFHAEHNRLRFDIDRLINTAGFLTAAQVAAWHATDPASGWGYGERLFQAARFVTEMEYQHLVFEEFARRIQPLINPFLGGLTSIDGAISAEFAHTVYRLGHSMLPEVVARINANGTNNDRRLRDVFLIPAAYNDGGTAGTLTAAAAIGSIARGMSRQVGNELDEFTVDSVRNTLVGLPLDLPAINIARGRSEGIASLNNVRKQFFTATQSTAVKPYGNWFEFGLNIKHHESLENFVAAYGTDPSITGATTAAAKRAAAAILVNSNAGFMFSPAATSGLDNVDFWIGGLAEKQSVFGGLLGSTFNFVFERQLEHLQDGDRFYYLQRTDGLDLRFQLEGNSFAELIRRNSDFSGGMDAIFSTADFNFDFNGADVTGSTLTTPFDLGGGMQLLTLADGTKVFFDPLHTGKNIVFNGGPGDDRFRADIGDDTLYGNDGNDRLDGAEGNDTVSGGAGDDVLFGGDGDDVLKGGPGNDALASGTGFGGDILLGGDGNDFLLGGDDGVEYFGGPGNDIIVDGAMRSEGMFAGPGDDWIDDGEGHDGGIFGDNGNVFDLLAGVGPVAGISTLEDGDDVLGGGPGQDNHFGEGGNDIMLMSEGSNKFFGDFGFDWLTLRGWPMPEFVELNLLALPNAPVNFNDLRNKYRFVDGASGWDLDDHIAGSNSVLCVPPGEIAECLVIGMELTAGTAPVSVPAVGVPGQVNFTGGSGAAKIDGLTALMGPTGFNKDLAAPAIPLVKGVGFMGGDIILGGLGSDLLEGKQGDDLIDGDLWLNVQLRAVMNDGTVRLVDGPRLLVDDVFADPQRLNPGNISIIRTIVTPVTPPADCVFSGPNGTIAETIPVAGPGGITFVNSLGEPVVPAPRNCDTAHFNFASAEYDIVANANGTVTVAHTRPGIGHLSEGIDTLRNIEQLRFTNFDRVTATILGFEIIPVPAFVPRTIVPDVVGLRSADASAAIAGAGLAVGVVTSAFDAVVEVGRVISQTPAGGTTVPTGSAVSFVVSLGPAPVIVPNVVGSTQAAATAAIVAAGLTLGAVATVNNAAPAGNVISQSPLAGASVAPGSGVALVVSLGPALVAVPNVVGSTQAAATAAITGAGLTVGAVTNAASTTVPAGNVISQSPLAGAAVTPGSAVALVVSTGAPAPVIAATAVRNLSAPNTTITSPTFSPPANSLLVAFVSADAPLDGTNTTVNVVRNSGGGLTWTRAVLSNVQRGTAEVWWAFTPVARAGMTVTAVLNLSEARSMTVMAFTGAAPSLVGAASLAANAPSGAPSATLVTTRANSLVLAVGTDWDQPRVMVPGAGQTIVNQFNPTVGDTYWVQRTTNGVGSAGTSVTISDSYGAAMPDRWNLALVEIRTQ